MKDLKYELGGHFEDIVVALMMPAADYDATSLRKAIKVGDGCFFVNKIVWHINSCVVTVLQPHVPEMHTCTASSYNTFMMISQKIETDNGLICLMSYQHKGEIYTMS